MTHLSCLPNKSSRTLLLLIPNQPKIHSNLYSTSFFSFFQFSRFLLQNLQNQLEIDKTKTIIIPETEVKWSLVQREMCFQTRPNQIVYRIDSFQARAARSRTYRKFYLVTYITYQIINLTIYISVSVTIFRNHFIQKRVK